MHYTYLIAINDFEFKNNGQDFFNSGSSITILNQLQNYEDDMVGSSGNVTAGYYFFGCVEILSSKFLDNSAHYLNCPFRWKLYSNKRTFRHIFQWGHHKRVVAIKR